MATNLSLLEIDLLRAMARELNAAPHGERGLLKAGFCKRLNCSLQTLHRKLKKIGWSSGRKRRADAGSCSVKEEVLIEAGAVLRYGVRANDKQTMEVPNAVALLTANGREIEVSNTTIRRHLKRMNLDARTQAMPTPHIGMRSLHPNHVHLVDPSLCLLYYSPDGKQRFISDAEAYKNKPDTFEKIGALKLWRYVLVDHFSNVVMVRYYQAAGENQANLWDFLLYCWSRLDKRPFHGIPRMLVWDKGSANTSSAIKNALRQLDVETYEHQAGNPRAKGAVEEANNRVEKLFESRLRYQPVSSVEELNRHAEAWTLAYNGNRIPKYDARLRRKGLAQPQARFDLWLRIRPEQLRILPDLEVCRHLLTAKPAARTVGRDMGISFVHPVAKTSLSYSLRGLSGILPGMKVQVSPLVMGQGCQVYVQFENYQGELDECLLAPLEYDEHGFRTDAPVWGERFDRVPDTAAMTAGKRADEAAFAGLNREQIEKAKARNATPFGGLDALTHLGEVYVPDYLDRRGTEMTLPARAQVELRPLDSVTARKLLVRALGRALTTDEAGWLRQAWPDGIPEEELPAIAAKLAGGTLDHPRLQVVT